MGKYKRSSSAYDNTTGVRDYVPKSLAVFFENIRSKHGATAGFLAKPVLTQLEQLFQ